MCFILLVDLGGRPQATNKFFLISWDLWDIFAKIVRSVELVPPLVPVWSVLSMKCGALWIRCKEQMERIFKNVWNSWQIQSF